MLRTVRTPVLIVVAALLAGACGGDTADKQAYIEQGNVIQKRVAGDLDALDFSKPASLDTAVASLDAAVDDFGALEVPGDYTDEHRQLVGSMEDMRDSMTDLKAAIVAKDPAAANAVQAKVQAAQSDYQKAISAMNADLR